MMPRRSWVHLGVVYETASIRNASYSLVHGVVTMINTALPQGETITGRYEHRELHSQDSKAIMGCRC